MNRIFIKAKRPGSKFFGNPDVWNKFEWPTAKDENGEDFYLDFICQIDCAEASKHDPDGLLPKSGMLYFFYDLDDHYAHNSKVIYYDGDFSKFIPYVVTDENDNETCLPEFQIDFESYGGEDKDDNGDYAQGRFTPNFLLGEPSDPEQLESSGGDGQLLLQVDSYIGDHDFNWGGDCGFLCFFIDKADLEKKDFNEVWTELAVY